MQHDGRFLNGLTLEDVSVSTQAEKGTLRVWEEAAGPRPLPETLGGGGCVCGGGVPEVEGRGPRAALQGAFWSLTSTCSSPMLRQQSKPRKALLEKNVFYLKSSNNTA